MVDGSECIDDFIEQEHHNARYTTSRNALNFHLLGNHCTIQVQHSTAFDIP
jgi:hypothetical protein